MRTWLGRQKRKTDPCLRSWSSALSLDVIVLYFSDSSGDLWKRNYKCRTISGFTSRRNIPTVPLDYFLADSKAHPGSFIRAASTVEPLEGGENLVEVLRLKPNAVVFDNDLAGRAGGIAGYLNNGLFTLFMEFESIPDEILE